MATHPRPFSSLLFLGLSAAAWLACADTASPVVEPIDHASPTVGGQSTDDQNPNAPHGDMAQRPPTCDRPGEPTALSAEQAMRLAWLDQDYPVVARADGSQSEVRVRATLQVTVQAERWFRVSGCAYGAEVEVAVELRGEDGDLMAAGDGVARLRPELLEAPPPNVFYDHRADLEAEVELAHDIAARAAPEGSGSSAERARLRATLTPLGSGGSLFAIVEPRMPQELDDGQLPTSAAPPGPLLAWPYDSGCPDGERGLTLGEGPEMMRLRSAITRLGMASAPVFEEADGGPEALGTLSIEVAQPSALCGSRLPTSASLLVEGADIALTADVAIHPGTAPTALQIGTDYEVPYVFTPEVFASQLGSVGLDLSDFTYVGIELWLRYEEDAPAGELRVVTWTGDDCLLCDDGACSECSEANKVVSRTLAIGAQQGS